MIILIYYDYYDKFYQVNIIILIRGNTYKHEIRMKLIFVNEMIIYFK